MKRFTLFSLIAVLFSGCIENDIPLPVIYPRITAIDAEGVSDVYINSERQEVILTLEEQTDIENVNIRSVSFENEQTRASWDLTGTHDLSNKLSVTLSIYQDYVWTISAEQSIERYCTVAGQVGATEIDDKNRRIVMYVMDTQDKSDITVTSLKLGPKDITTYSPAMEQMKDFTDGQRVEVTAHGRTEVWMLYVEQTETVVEMKGVDAWTGVAWLRASGIAELKNGFKYRKQGEAEWIDLSGDKLTIDGGAFSAAAEPLQPLTTYECYAYSGDNKTETYTFTTEQARQLVNPSFEVFSNAESDKYYSFYNPVSSIIEQQTKWWCSGNKGATTVGESYSITNPDANDKMDGRYSARLESEWVIIKFAAGNIFVGEFVRVVGTSGGVINFGRPFEQRPRMLSLWLKYEGGIINRVDRVPDNDPVKEGDPDRCQVFVAVGDWDYRKYGGTPDCPVQVNTLEPSTYFNPKSEAVIGYGCYVSNKSTDGWIKVEIPIEYVSTSRKPTHIIVSCAASMLGDYFTGSDQSTLWVDGMELHY